MCISTMTTTSKDGGVSSKYAVIRLKNTDNILGLFQLLLHNGYSQVSFVNSLNETIFPLNDRHDKCTQTSTTLAPPLPTPPLQMTNSFNAHYHHGGRNETAGSRLAGAHQSRSTPTSTLSPFDRKPLQQPLPPSSVAAALSALDLLPPGLSHHFGQLTTLPTIPSGFLGLPTLPTLLAPHCTVNVSANSGGHHGIFSVGNSLLAAADATTPPYSVNNNILNSNGGGHHHHGHHHHHKSPSKHSITGNNANLKQIQRLVDISPPLPPVIMAPSTAVENNRPRSSHASMAELTNGVHHATGGVNGNNKHAGNNHNSWQNATTDPISQMILQTVPTATNTQLRQRGQRSYNDDPSLYVTCRLCKNRIMGSRISNLTNHVRRHSTLKQFQCCYCDYTHNEMAKVRLHMLHNHKDKDSQPIDNLSPEMQIAWEQLMKECFPNHCQQQQQQQHLPQQQQQQQQQLQQPTSFVDDDDVDVDDVDDRCGVMTRISTGSSSNGGQSWKDEDDDDVIMTDTGIKVECCDENGESDVSGAIIIYDGGSSSVESSAGSDGCCGKEKEEELEEDDDLSDDVIKHELDATPLTSSSTGAATTTTVAPSTVEYTIARMYTPKYRKRFKIM